jgi:hypothetical protein
MSCLIFYPKGKRAEDVGVVVNRPKSMEIEGEFGNRNVVGCVAKNKFVARVRERSKTPKSMGKSVESA